MCLCYDIVTFVQKILHEYSFTTLLFYCVVIPKLNMLHLKGQQVMLSLPQVTVFRQGGRSREDILIGFDGETTDRLMPRPKAYPAFSVNSKLIGTIIYKMTIMPY